MTQANTGALLDIETLLTRPVIAIDGETYQIRSPGELSVVESLRFGRWGKRIDALQTEDGEEGDDELDKLVATVARAILVDVPDAVFEKLAGTQRWAIIDVFTGLLLREKLKVAGAMTTATGPMPAGFGNLTGASSYLGSSGSTVAAPPNGFTARLRRLFGRS